MGRTSKYTDAIADEICERLANGTSLTKICSDEHIPCRSTVLAWQDERPDFHARCMRARVHQGQAVADEIGDIERMLLAGEITAEVARTLISSKQWRSSKLDPKGYGDRISQEVSGPGGEALTVQLNIHAVAPTTGGNDG